jgi:hypothetical protein
VPLNFNAPNTMLKFTRWSEEPELQPRAEGVGAPADAARRDGDSGRGCAHAAPNPLAGQPAIQAMPPQAGPSQPPALAAPGQGQQQQGAGDRAGPSQLQVSEWDEVPCML